MARDTQYTLYIVGRCDPTFSNVWGFDNSTQRDNFLISKNPYPVLDCKYWRPGSSVIVPISYEDSFSYDYIRIVNDSTTADKARTWFCFIISREYISNNATRLNLQIDYFQTFYFSHTLDGSTLPFWNVNGYISKTTMPMAIERGTPCDFPVPVPTPVSIQFSPNDFAAVVYSTVDLRSLTTDSTTYTQAVIEGVYMAAPPYVFRGDILTTLSSIFLVLNEKGLTDAVTGVYIVPTRYLADTVLTVALCDETQLTTYTYTVTPPTTCDGYTPVNAILLSHDYSYFTINNNQGETQIYHFEDFDGAPQFSATMSVSSGSPVLNIRPNNYRDTAIDNYRQRAQKYTQMPACTYVNDSYKIWLAQTQNSRAAAIDAARDEIAFAETRRNSSWTYQLAEAGNIGEVIRGIGSATSGVVSKLESMREGYKASATRNPLANILETIAPDPVRAMNSAYDVRPMMGLTPGFKGGSSSGGGAGAYFGTNSAGEIAGDAAAMAGSSNMATSLGGFAMLYVYKQLGLEENAELDANVARAQNRLNTLLAGYLDKAAIPATARGSNAYGDMTALNQVGFTITVFTPTAYYAEWIDKMLTAGGTTVNKFGSMLKAHQVFDFYQTTGARIMSDPENRPQYVRNMMISALAGGIYIWHYNNGDISPYIGIPYNISNPEVS